MGVTPAQLVLAWTLAIAPNTLVIPGASSVDHLRENLAASAVPLDHRAVERLAAM